MRSKTLTLWGSAALLSVTASVSAAPKAATLPLTRVRLYETGVGYFERSGAVPAGDTALPVPAGHLDDALKTLVVLGGDVKVNGVVFGSSVSRDMGRTLAGLPLADDTALGFSELARSFKGASISLVTKSGPLSGRLVEVLDPGQGELERCSKPQYPVDADTEVDQAARPVPVSPVPCELIERGSLLLLTPAGELRRIASVDVTSLRPTEPAARARLDAALDALSQRGPQTQRDLGVLTAAGGKVTLGYVAEAPVWRSTYRIVLNGDQAQLQGWALLHNDTDEGWQGVQLDLVNGRPASFLYPLAAPRYARRELVTPDQQLESVPQLFDTTVDNMWSGVHRGHKVRMGGIRLGHSRFSSIGEGAGGYGEGLNPESDELSIGNLAALAPAEGIEAAALFRYTLPTKLSLAAHATALVPFLDAPLLVRRVAWFPIGGTTAASALHVTNDTKQTLPGGTISVFSDGGFAGESLLPRTKPNQRHLLGYGVDLDVELERSDGPVTEEPRLFKYADERLAEHYLRRRALALRLTNRSGSSRSVYVELDVVDNARVEGAPELGRDADTQKTYAVVHVPASKGVAHDVRLEEGLRRDYYVNKLTARNLRYFAAAKAIPAAQRATLTRAAAQLALAEARSASRAQRRAQIDVALSDVARLRENARVLGNAGAEQAATMAEKVVELEARVAQLRQANESAAREEAGFVAAAKRELGKL